MSCVLTMRPASSTMSGTFCAGVADLRHDDVERRATAPLSTRRGVSTRVTCTSRVSRSLPTPTVNTGIACALSPAIDSSIVALGVVGAVAHEHEAGDRQAAQLVARAIERVAQARARALET